MLTLSFSSDIKPDNILLDARGHAHLTDFNVAIHYSERRLHTSVAGSMAYMAPQVVIPDVSSFARTYLPSSCPYPTRFQMKQANFDVSHELDKFLMVEKPLTHCYPHNQLVVALDTACM